MLITLVLILLLAAVAMSNFLDLSVLNLPESVVSTVITPIQSAFSGVTIGISGYLRTLKLRSTL